MKRMLLVALVSGPVGAILLLTALGSLALLAALASVAGAGTGVLLPGDGLPVGPPLGPTPGLTGGPPSAFAVADIPATMLALYQQAAPGCPGLPWSILAAIGKVETNHGRDVRVSSAGAQGPMQFLPATWAKYGVYADADGVADIGDPADSVVSAAGYLCANGASTAAGWSTAIWNYNHDPAYVALVFGLAGRYEREPPPAA
jgi:hypothetical protein